MSLTSRLTSASNIKESSVTCRLDDLPPVTEMEHQLGRCYCQLCSCGFHTCPGDMRDNMLGSRQYPTVSEYRNKFKIVNRSLGEQKELKNSRANFDYFRTQIPMDLKTTKQLDYQRYNQIERVEPTYNSNTITTKKAQFNGKSSYAQCYNAYNDYSPVLYKKINPKYRGHKIRLQSLSTYKQHFAEMDQQPLTARPHSKTNSNPLNTSIKFQSQSTLKRDYQPPTKIIPQSQIKPSDNISSSREQKGFFNTTYKNHYPSIQLQYLPRKREMRGLYKSQYKMSIYSGFGTRAQESQYDSLTEALIHTLQMHAVSQLRGDKVNLLEWSKYTMKILKNMQRMENRKYLPPKLSDACLELQKFIKSQFARCELNSRNQSISKINVRPTQTPIRRSDIQSYLTSRNSSPNARQHLPPPNLRNSTTSPAIHQKRNKSFRHITPLLKY